MQRHNTVPVAIYYRATWQILILLAAVQAVASAVVRPLIGIPFFLISFLLVTSYGGALGRDARGRRKISAGIGIAIFLLTIHQIVRIQRFEQLVEVMIELICGFLPILLLNHERPRAYWLSMLNVAIIGVSSITFSSSILVYLGFLAFIAALLFNMNAANLYLSEVAGESSREDLSWRYFRQFLFVMPIGLASALFIFLAFPRVQSFTMSLGSLVSSPKTGYSGMISLSGGGEIENSSAVAFIVESPDRNWLRHAAVSGLFRGDSLESFDGTRWSSNIFSYRRQSEALDSRIAKRHKRPILDLTVHMEPTLTSAVFYPGVLVTVSTQPSNAGKFLLNANGSLSRGAFSQERYFYSLRISEQLATKNLPAVSLRALARSVKASTRKEVPPYELDAKELQSYLEIPDAIKTAPFFAAWVRELAIDVKELTLAGLATLIKQHFASKFVASLDNKFSTGNSFEAFLSVDRKGHCEYFATSTALLLRSLGLPSRVVVGYKGGTYNDYIDALEVRDENGHAWVETFLPGIGWHGIDPTPSSVDLQTESFANNARLYMNALGFWFRQYVIDYDQSTQRELMRSIKGTGSKNQREHSHWKAYLYEYGRPALIAGALIAFTLLLMRMARRRSERFAMPEYYLRFLSKMARRGRERRPGETYHRYHERLGLELKDSSVEPGLVMQLGLAIERDLYAYTPLDASEQSLLLDAVKRIPSAGRKV